MTLDEAQEIITHILCIEFEELGMEMGLTKEQLFEKIREDKDAKGWRDMSRGLFDVSLVNLHVSDDIGYQGSSNTYFVGSDVFLNWLDTKPANTNNEADKEWSPLQVQDHEELADKIDEVVDALAAENGYVEEYYVESQHTIATSKELSVSLRDNEGAVLFKHLEHVLTVMERLFSIFERGSRIGKIVKSVITMLLSIIS